MALYELRTYTLYVGKMAEATRLYQQLGFPALAKGGHDKKLIGYFQGDTGTINQLVHLWKFDDDADRRAHWAAVTETYCFGDLKTLLNAVQPPTVVTDPAPSATLFANDALEPEPSASASIAVLCAPEPIAIDPALAALAFAP